MRPTRALLIAFFVMAICYAVLATGDASISVRIVDARTGQPTPVRVRLLDSNGNPPKITGALAVSDAAFGVPAAAIGVMYGQSDRAEGFLLQPDGAFYVDGSFDVKLPAGNYTLSLSKGYEYVQQTHKLSISAGKRTRTTYRMERWINMPERGWYSSDDHIHLRRSSRDDASIVRWISAEDIHVGHLLQMGDFWATYYSQYAWGEKGRYRERDNILSPGQEEPRTPEIGHTISLGAEDFVRFQPDYYSYDRVFDRVHELDGITGFAHQATTFHGYRGMALNVLRGKIDFLELMQFCAAEGPLVVDHYYRFLDLGYRLTALAGSDFPWCGRGPRYGLKEGGSQIGDSRFYTYVGNEFTFASWLKAVKAGHTFASSGPIVQLTVNGRLPGDTVNVRRGEVLKIKATAFGESKQIPLEELEIVGHGEVLRAARAAQPGQSAAQLAIDMETAADHGLWIAARVKAGPTQLAHTTPVYVSVDGGGFENRGKFRQRISECEQHLDELEKELVSPGERLDHQATRHKKSLLRQISETREILASLKSRSE